MTPIGAIFLVVGILSAAYISHQRLLDSRGIPFLLFIYHLSFALIYWWYSLSYPADSVRYYRAARGPDITFGLGTVFIEWLTQQMYITVQASYLDLFLLFHIAGFFGLCLLYNTILEIVIKPVSLSVKRMTLIIFFLPGLHFWTSSIGKDSIIFLGINLVLWSLIYLNRRFWLLLSGLSLVFLVRPHVAMILLASIGFALIWSREVPLYLRILGTLTGFAIFSALLPFTLEYIRLDSLDTISVADYIQKLQQYDKMGGGSVNIGSYPFPFQVFTYLFRPLFLDAKNLFGIFVSFENIILLIISVRLFSPYFYKMLKTHSTSLFMWTNLFYFSLFVSTFSLVTANLGIAIRQKTMVLPSLFILIFLSDTIRNTSWTKKKTSFKRLYSTYKITN